MGAEPRTVGFGRLGLTIGGNGGVPPAAYSLGNIYGGVPLQEKRQPDAVVINLGTNDARAQPKPFAVLYQAYLEAVRGLYPRAHIFCLRPFNGSQGEAVREAALALEHAGDGRVHYVDTAGWIDKDKHTTDGVHLNLEGNHVAGEKMAAILKENK